MPCALEQSRRSGVDAIHGSRIRGLWRDCQRSERHRNRTETELLQTSGEEYRTGRKRMARKQDKRTVGVRSMKRSCLPLVEVAPGRMQRGHVEPATPSHVSVYAERLIGKRPAHLTMTELELTLPYMVSGKNSVKTTRTGQRYPTKRFDIWRGEVITQMENQCPVSSLANRFLTLRCEIRYWPNDKRTRDVPGMEDALCHCLERAGIIANDGQIKHTSFTTEALQDDVRLIVNLRVCP